MTSEPRTVRLAALADLHYARTPELDAAPILEQLDDEADVLLLCGDLPDRGTAEEARGLADFVRRHVRPPSSACSATTTTSRAKRMPWGAS